MKTALSEPSDSPSSWKPCCLAKPKGSPIITLMKVTLSSFKPTPKRTCLRSAAAAGRDPNAATAPVASPDNMMSRRLIVILSSFPSA